jgi:hypothetical protein
VDKNQVGSMVSSLNRAYQQVLDANIVAESNNDIKQAWNAMKKNKHEQFFALLEQAAKKFVVALDGWEKNRNG